MYSYKTKGICAKEMNFDIVDGVIRNLKIVGGCKGNIKALELLVEGMKAEDVVSKMRGIPCQGDTSCPDQLSKAIELYM
ncbi:MAG: TIGR03905 family TSCPD domain-containing protein [Clostridiaceae bacterium]